MVEKAKEETKKETPKIDDVPEMSDKETNEVMEKILNAFKEAATETPVVNKEAEYLDKIARQQADFENYRKRMEKEKQEHIINANANLISEILPTLDHFELALKHNKDKGIVMIYDELNDILKNNGVRVIDTKGIFNPRLHEVVLTAEGDKDGVILEEIQKGFLLNDKLLRASKVKVSRVREKK
jgi:molecular chaperone GrpE